MSEYIGVRGEVVGCDKGGKPLYSMYLTDEEIVRCRDCIYWIDEDYCINPKWRIGRTCERPCTEPNGFCAWAERKERPNVRFSDLYGILKEE